MGESKDRYTFTLKDLKEEWPYSRTESLCAAGYLFDIIEKYRVALEYYGSEESYTLDNRIYAKVLIDRGRIARNVLKLTEEADNETLRSELGTMDIDTTPEELQRLREE